MAVFIGGAWPYANGSLHLGHLAALLPGDIIARYYRLKGEDVLYVSGSDCNGTPISIRAKQENKSVKEIADLYHEEFQECFHSLGFTYDHYTRTDSTYHHQVVRATFLELLKNDWLYKRIVKQAFCISCDQFLPDRFVVGVCPNCESNCRGDQCENCSTILDPIDLKERSCKFCQEEPIFKETEHFYLALSKIQTQLEIYIHQNKNFWRGNAIQMTNRYLTEGLLDRAVTRDIEVGVTVPVEGYENKKVYVWIDAVSGYLSAAQEWAQINKREWHPFWQENTVSYYIHGKDNIPFHTIIWPSILLGSGILSLPKHIISSEYLTIEKKKLSTSGNWAIWIKDLLSRYNPDTIRYFLTINGPEKRDADFSWREFIYRHNGELLGSLGNLVQRTIKFYQKEFGPIFELTNINQNIKEKIERIFDESGAMLERGDCKKSLDSIFEFVRWGNKYFDEQKPWAVLKENREEAREVLHDCLYVIINLGVLLQPFLPFTTEKIVKGLSLEQLELFWQPVETPVQLKITLNEPLFKRIDIEQIDKEREKLGNTTY
ncbi:methionyl-tRNA synthetase [Bacillus pakistanensis]|uniref:Methionine--tRNA ligase n=1 Tax=Rossellomorea pakistanensis TaxID=992288 RepID=A0ABS2N8G7_9BACI|nr:methionine--tRNA ligase [Bacillus pakistanensis]MBM7584161.1 methionyl-tRNA synthetase [Bacillus pakistanensis]